MNRRKFLAVFGISFLCPKPKPVAAKEPEIPFVPTLEWLQEHNPDIESLHANYDANRRTWSAFIHRKIEPVQTWEEHRCLLSWENHRWIAVDEFIYSVDGSRQYGNQIEWPDWLRKF